MSMLRKIRQLWDHILWADRRIQEALRQAPDLMDAPDMPPYTDARREFAHIIGSEENWLARLEHRTPRAPVRPDVSAEELDRLAAEVHRGFGAFLDGLSEGDLAGQISYRNSKGEEFTNEVGDILLHVALHGQYHRGKINLLLRLAGEPPAPSDYIAFIRGIPAATEQTS